MWNFFYMCRLKHGFHDWQSSKPLLKVGNCLEVTGTPVGILLTCVILIYLLCEEKILLFLICILFSRLLALSLLVVIG